MLKSIIGPLGVVAAVAALLVGCGDSGNPVGPNNPINGGGTFIDGRDGKSYKMVMIGTQMWMAENLSYTTGNSKCYNDSSSNCATHGRLYDWETALTACPAGTHLPTDKEWTTLVDYAGGEEKAGTRLKSSTGWRSYKKIPAGTNKYGFSALPGGFRYYSTLIYGEFDFIGAGISGRWWSATEDNAGGAWDRDMYSNHEGIIRYNYDKAFLFSVRCVAD